MPKVAKLRRGEKHKTIEFVMPKQISDALEDYRASKRPIPTESDAIRWLLTEALTNEGFEPKQDDQPFFGAR